MALDKSKLQASIKNRILALKPTLIARLDGSPIKSNITTSASLFQAMGNIEIKCKSLGKAGAFDPNVVKQISSNEWSNAISSQVITFLAEDISLIIAEEVDAYVKQIKVIIPLGQEVYAADASGGGYGYTNKDSAPGKIS